MKNVVYVPTREVPIEFPGNDASDGHAGRSAKVFVRMPEDFATRMKDRTW